MDDDGHQGRGARRRCPRTVGNAVVSVAMVTGCGTSRQAPAGGSAAAEVDGRVVFFGVLPDDTSSGLVLLDLATGDQQRVGDQQEAWSAAWLGPQRLALVSGAPRISTTGPGQLVLHDVDAGTLAGAGTAAAPVPPVGLDTGVTDVREVATSDDGEHLALLGRTEPSSAACLDPAPAARLGLFVAGADGDGVRRVVDVATTARSLVLSPDGRTAAYVDDGDDAALPPGADWCAPGDPRLVLVDTATGAQRVVDGAPTWLENPRFSPDGATLVLQGSDHGSPDRDVVLVDVATGTATRLSTPETSETRPAFSPDGRSLAVVRSEAGSEPFGSATVAVGRADGTDLLDVAPSGTGSSGLAWTRDGAHLLVAVDTTEMDCDGAAAGCDTSTSTTDLRLVAVDGGGSRQVSAAVTGGDAGLAVAP